MSYFQSEGVVRFIAFVEIEDKTSLLNVKINWLCCCIIAVLRQSPPPVHRSSLLAPGCLWADWCFTSHPVTKNLALVLSSVTHSLLTGAGAHTTCFTSVFCSCSVL